LAFAPLGQADSDVESTVSDPDSSWMPQDDQDAHVPQTEQSQESSEVASAAPAEVQQWPQPVGTPVNPADWAGVPTSPWVAPAEELVSWQMPTVSDDPGHGDTHSSHGHEGLSSHDVDSHDVDSHDIGEDLDDLFAEDDAGSAALERLLTTPSVVQVMVNRHNRILFTDHSGTHVAAAGFSSPMAYQRWLRTTLMLTTLDRSALDGARVASGVFTGTQRGSVHLAPAGVTGSEPAIVIRRWVTATSNMNALHNSGMLDSRIRMLLEAAVRGRTGILISGGSGSAKTSLLRACAFVIEPSSRVVVVEGLPELDLAERLPDVVGLSDPTMDNLGALVGDAVAMRPDRLVVGSVAREGWEALSRYATSTGVGVLAATSAISPVLAVAGAVDSLRAAGVGAGHAVELVTSTFGLVVHLGRAPGGRRVVESVMRLKREGDRPRLEVLHRFDPSEDSFVTVSEPDQALVLEWARWGVAGIDPS
jgi:Flp pilus assembly CpaF family ATPase